MRRGWIISVCLSFLILVPAGSYSINNVGKVLKVKNTVYIVRNSQKKNAKPLMPIMLEDAIETGKKSRTRLMFKDDSILNLGELSRVIVQEYLSAPGTNRSKSIYKLIDGYLKVIVGKSDLKIHSPTAVVAARGTEFVIWTEGSGPSESTGIIMIKGKAELRNINELVSGILIIRQGQMSRVFRDKPPEKPRPYDLKIIEDLEDMVGDIKESSGGSRVEGEVINRSDIDQSTNVSSGEGSESNVCSIIMK